VPFILSLDELSPILPSSEYIEEVDLVGFSVVSRLGLDLTSTSFLEVWFGLDRYGEPRPSDGAYRGDPTQRQRSSELQCGG